jgi:hypothetical protein
MSNCSQLEVYSDISAKAIIWLVFSDVMQRGGKAEGACLEEATTIRIVLTESDIMADCG